MVGCEAEGESHHVSTEDAKLSGCTDEHHLWIGEQSREVGHGADAKEDERWIPSGANASVEDVEHRAVFVDAYFVSELERNVTNQNTKPDWHKQHRFEFMLYRKINEEQTHKQHNQVWSCYIVKSGEFPELLEVLAEKRY